MQAAEHVFACVWSVRVELALSIYVSPKWRKFCIASAVQIFCRYICTLHCGGVKCTECLDRSNVAAVHIDGDVTSSRRSSTRPIVFCSSFRFDQKAVFLFAFICGMRSTICLQRWGRRWNDLDVLMISTTALEMEGVGMVRFYVSTCALNVRDTDLSMSTGVRRCRRVRIACRPFN